MFIQQFKYQASIFYPYVGIDYNTDSILYFTNKLSEYGLVPNSLLEQRLDTEVTNQRLQMAAGGLTVNFLGERIDIIRTPVEGTFTDLPSLEHFYTEALNILSKIEPRIPTRSNRLSLVTTGYVNELSTDRLNEVYGKFFLPISVYSTNTPIEWANRSVTRISKVIDDKNELLNVINEISRRHIQIPEINNKSKGLQQVSMLDLDTLLIHLDINTFQGNAEPRFEESFFSAFFRQVSELNLEMSNELVNRITQ